MKRKKILLWLVMIVLFLLIAAKGVEIYAEKRFSNRVIPIKDKVSIIIGDIDVSLLNGGVILNDVRLLDTLDPAAVGEIDQVAVQGIRWMKLISGGGFSMRGLKVQGATCALNLDRLKADTSTVLLTDTTGQAIPLAEEEDIDTTYKMLYFAAPTVHIRFDQDMHPEIRTLDIEHIKFRPNEGKYDVDVGSISSSHNLKMIEIDSFQLIPRYSKYEFGFQAGRRMASIDILVEQIEVHNFDLRALTRDSMLSISAVICKRAMVDVFSDKRLPIDMVRYGALPHEALLNASTRIAIDSVIVKDADVRYTALNPNTMEEGYLEFKRSYLSLYNITNIPERIEAKSSMMLDLHSNFTNEGELNAHFDFPLNRKDYQFTWNGTLGTMKLGNLDSFVLPIANMNIIDGYCHGLAFSIVSGYDTSRGDLRFQYTNLKVMAMDSEHNKELKFLSSLANVLVVKSNNLVGDKNFFEGPIIFARQKNRGFPDYVWKSLESGILHSIIGKSLAARIENQPAKSKAKESRKEERRRKREEKKHEKGG